VTNQAGLACADILVTHALRLLVRVGDVIDIFAVSGFTGVTGGGVVEVKDPLTRTVETEGVVARINYPGRPTIQHTLVAVHHCHAKFG
jgi:hypothetical protein